MSKTRIRRVLIIAIGILLIGSLIVALSVGLRKNGEADSENQEEKELITKEYLIETYELTEEEYADVDLDAFIAKYSLTEENLKKIDVKIFLERYKERMNEVKIEDENAIYYNYLVNNERSNKKIKEDELTNIKTISFLITRGVEYESLIVDYEKEMIYYGTQMNLLKDGVVPTWTVELDEEKKATIQEMWEQCGILSWKQKYEEWDSSYSETMGWALYLELEDGTIKKYEGGYMGEVTPEGFGVLASTLEQWNVKLVTVSYLESTCGIKAEDYEGVDLEAFIKDNLLTYEKVWEVDVYTLLEEYKTNQNTQPSEGTSENE